MTALFRSLISVALIKKKFLNYAWPWSEGPRKSVLFLSHVWPFRLIMMFRKEVIVRHRCLLLEGLSSGRELGSFLSRAGAWAEVI